MRLPLPAANRAAIAVLAGAVRWMLLHNTGLTGVCRLLPPAQPNRSAISVVDDGAVEFVYVTNSGSKNVSAYSIDPDGGALTPLVGRRLGLVLILGQW